MPTQTTPRAGLRVFQYRDRNWHLPVIAFAGQVDAAPGVGQFAAQPGAYDADLNPSGLTVAVAGGPFVLSNGTAVVFPGGTVTVPASAVTYVWVTEAASLNTGAAWPAAPHVRVAVVTASGSAVTDITDARTLYRSGLGPPPAGPEQAALTDSTSGSLAAFTLLNGASTVALTDSTGGVASTTLPALTNTATLTDSTGGVASTTLAAVADAPTADALASLAAQLAVQRTLNAALVNDVASLAAAVNALRSDAGRSNDNVARLARLQNAVRSALITAGLIKGSA